MSHFEYVSVAIALMYAMALNRLISGFSPIVREGARYPIHVGWVLQLILVSVMQWWVFWRASQVDWTPIRFLWVLAVPAVMLVRASVLIGEHPEVVESFRDHFFQRRVRFFSLGIASSILGCFGPWVLGIVPWFTAAPIHPVVILVATISLAGVVLKSPRAHAALLLLSLLLAAAAFFLVPAVQPAA